MNLCIIEMKKIDIAKYTDIYLRYKLIFSNLFFVGLVQIFSLIAPLITYPYLVRVLGSNLYGMVISAQVLVSYATMIIDFGSNSVCAKDISINRYNNIKISEIVSSVLVTRSFLWMMCFFIYLLIIYMIPMYRPHILLFVLSYLMTVNELLFPQFFFQGLERMKIVSLLNVLIKFLFIILVFLFVKEKNDYLLVPLLYAIGYAFAGILSLYLIFVKMKIKFFIPSIKIQISYFRECFPLLATNLVRTIKDRFNYVFIGAFVSMSDVVVYDLGIKLIGVIAQPTNVLTTVLLPRFAKNRNVDILKKILFFVFLSSIIIVVITNVFLPEIISFFIKDKIDLYPIRIFLLAPIFLCTGFVIFENFYISFGYNKYAIYSILITTIVYIFLLLAIFMIDKVQSVYSYIYLALICYIVEFIYRLYTFFKLTK